MAFRFPCPNCGKRLKASAGHVGRKTKCPDCGAALVVPAEDAVGKTSDSPSRVTQRHKAEAELVDLTEPPVAFKRPKTEDDGLDMTPMVDVTFLLLIFFMVTAAFSLQKAIEVPPTEQEAASQRTLEDLEEDKDYVVVRIDEDNIYHISSPQSDAEQDAPSESELLALLRAARTPATPGGSVPTKLMVLAHGDARHKYVVKALDAGTEVGMEEVKLSAMEDEDF